MGKQVEPLVPGFTGSVTWPKGTSIIQVVVEPGTDVEKIYEAICDKLADTSGLIVERPVSVDV